MSNSPKLTLAGAGPGDPDLISVKAVKALKQADAVLYDALVDPRLLEYCNPETELVYVGKRSGKHSFKQEEINRLIVAYAFNCGHVVRLKGGDPFVFGRGQEEREYAEAFNIPVHVIPGISSALAVPTSQSIPLTARGINDSFWVMTATKSAGQLSEDIRVAATSSATVIILMGIRKLSLIARLYSEQGRADIPVAVIQNGTTAHEKAVFGTMEDIVARVEDAGISTPGIIVVGKVVGVNQSLVQRELVEQVVKRYGK